MFNLFNKKNVQPVKYQSKFGNYLRYTEEETAVSIIVELALEPFAPDKNFPKCIMVNILYDVQTEHGLPTNEQLIQLTEWEDHILKIAQNNFLHYHFATISQNGYRTIALYCPSQATKQTFEKEVSALLGSHAERLLIQVFEDANWDAYLQDVYPLPFQLQEINNHSLVHVMKENGDQSAVARPIEHYVYFPESLKENILKYKSWLAENQFEILSENPREKQLIQLRFSREDCPDFYVINDVCLPLWDYAEQLGGMYDGWETQIVANET